MVNYFKDISIENSASCI